MEKSKYKAEFADTAWWSFTLKAAMLWTWVFFSPTDSWCGLRRVEGEPRGPLPSCPVLCPCPGRRRARRGHRSYHGRGQGLPSVQWYVKANTRRGGHQMPWQKKSTSHMEENAQNMCSVIFTLISSYFFAGPLYARLCSELTNVYQRNCIYLVW